MLALCQIASCPENIQAVRASGAFQLLKEISTSEWDEFKQMASTVVSNPHVLQAMSVVYVRLIYIIARAAEAARATPSERRSLPEGPPSAGVVRREAAWRGQAAREVGLGDGKGATAGGREGDGAAAPS